LNFSIRNISRLRKAIGLRAEYKKLKRGFDLVIPVEGRYFVTTERGIFLISPGKGRLLTQNPGYGLSFSGDMAFCSVDKDNISRICMLPKESLLDGTGCNKDKYTHVLYETPCRSSNGRIHQVTVMSDGRLLFTNTGRNSIAILDSGSGDIEEFTPFPDRFGVPIMDDHNHINSVIEYDGMIYFIAYKAGVKSLIGCIKGNDVKGFFYKNQGMHDIYKTKQGFLTLDTFGEGKGYAITEKGNICSEFLSNGEGYVLRGAAGNDTEWILGHSHKGPRKKRFEGRGGLIVIKNGQCSFIELPASQVYQVIRYDGNFFDCSENKKSLFDSLTCYFGPPEYTAQTSCLPQ